MFKFYVIQPTSFISSNWQILFFSAFGIHNLKLNIIFSITLMRFYVSTMNNTLGPIRSFLTVSFLEQFHFQLKMYCEKVFCCEMSVNPSSSSATSKSTFPLPKPSYNRCFHLETLDIIIERSQSS